MGQFYSKWKVIRLYTFKPTFYHNAVLNYNLCKDKIFYSSSSIPASSPSVSKGNVDVGKKIHIQSIKKISPSNYAQIQLPSRPTLLEGIKLFSSNILNYKKIFFTTFLPQNYPNSVFPQYSQFSKWLFLQNVMGASICGIYHLH